jgi:hypothetical protein
VTAEASDGLSRNGPLDSPAPIHDRGGGSINGRAHRVSASAVVGSESVMPS